MSDIIVTIGENGTSVQVSDARPMPTSQEGFLQRAKEHDEAIKSALAAYEANKDQGSV